MEHKIPLDWEIDPAKRDIIEKYIQELKSSSLIEEFTFTWVGPEPLQPSLGGSEEEEEKDV